MSNTIRRITGEELDRKFDADEDILDYVDIEHPVVEPHPLRC